MYFTESGYEREIFKTNKCIPIVLPEKSSNFKISKFHSQSFLKDLNSRSKKCISSDQHSLKHTVLQWNMEANLFYESVHNTEVLWTVLKYNI